MPYCRAPLPGCWKDAKIVFPMMLQATVKACLTQLESFGCPGAYLEVYRGVIQYPQIFWQGGVATQF